MTNQRRILTENSYTFSKYGELQFPTEDVLEELGAHFKTEALNLTPATKHPVDTEGLTRDLRENLSMVDPSSEAARRETLIFPTLRAICRAAGLKLKIEYPIKVSDLLKGTLDYFIPNGNNLLVVEAKQADLSKGFTQLAVELIALSQWQGERAGAILYGVVTTGESWKFGVYNPAQQFVVKDTATYALPNNTGDVIAIIWSILKGLPA
jgi:hypothetical protein